MTTTEINDAAWKAWPYTWKNTRGAGTVIQEYIDKNGKKKIYRHFITFGIPDPPRGKKPDKLKGGDRIGFHMTEITPDMVGKQIAIFTSIEIKGPGDKLDKGQIDWHNLVLFSGGISEIWQDDNGEIKIIRKVIK